MAIAQIVETYAGVYRTLIFSRDFRQSHPAFKLVWVYVNVMILQIRPNSIDVKGY